MNKQALIAFVFVIIGISGILAYVTFSGAQNIQSQNQQLAPTPNQTSGNQQTANYTFIVYKWIGGNVTHDMLYEYAGVRGAIRTDLLFTYQIDTTGGLASLQWSHWRGI